MDQLINSRIDILKELISFIDEDIIPLYILEDNDFIIITEAISHLKTLSTSISGKSIFQLAENTALSSNIANIVKKILNAYSITASKEENRKLVLHINSVVNKLNHNGLTITNSAVDLIYTKYSDKLQDMVAEFKKYRYIWDIYSTVIDKVSSSDELIDINESVKDYILGSKDIEWSSGELNPFFKSFGLIPITNTIRLDILAMLAFGKSTKTLSGLSALAKQKKVDLIVIKKLLDRGIKYNILDLLDYAISKDYSISNADDDGITQKTIDRFDNINYISNTINNFSVKYKYIVKSDRPTVLIIEELATGVYHILSTNLGNVLTEKKDIPNGFMEFVFAGKHSTRISEYNSLLNKKIVKNMFLDVHFDINEKSKQITRKSTDPTYMKVKIYKGIMDEYRVLASKPIDSVYKFSKIVHDKKFSKIFSDTILETYYSYLNTSSILKRLDVQNIPKTEIYTSFMVYLNKYEKDFAKKIHDDLNDEIVRIQKDKILDQPDAQKQLEAIFDQLVSAALASVISADSNLFESLDNKLYLTKLSLID
jgi:hypothetical protein